MLEGKDKKIAARLAALAVEAGDRAPAEVSAALNSLLANRTLGERKRFVRGFLKILRRDLRKETLVIEHAGPLQESTVTAIADAFGAGRPRPLKISQKENPDLIGGLRVRLGDNVFDASIIGHLGRMVEQQF